MLTREMLHEFLKTATCEEVKTMIGDKYIRCGNPAVAIVKHWKRDEGPYALCESCARHNIDNRGAILVLACSQVGLDEIKEINHGLRYGTGNESKRTNPRNARAHKTGS